METPQKGMLRHPRDSSELSSSPGFAKLEHQLDTNMVSKSPRDYNDAMRLDKKKWQTHIGRMQWTLSLTQIHEYKGLQGHRQGQNSIMEKLSHLMVSKRSESTLYMQSNMMADSKQDLLQMGHLTKEPV